MHSIFGAEQRPAGEFSAPVPADFLQLLVDRARTSAESKLGAQKNLVFKNLVHTQPRIILDGPSGSGKSTLAKFLAAQLQAELVQLDNVYASWDGLAEAGQRVAKELLTPLANGQDGKIRHWDWYQNQPSKWQTVSVLRPTVIEGSAALNRATAPLATLCIWVEVADSDARKARALTQRPGGDIYAPYWEHWGAQERAHIAQENPRELADLWVKPGVLPGDPLYFLVQGSL